MIAYTIRRLLASILVLFAVSILIFLMIHLVPGDPVEVMLHETVASDEAMATMRRSLGLDRPLPEQYAIWLVGNTFSASREEAEENVDVRLGVIRGDFGRSIFRRVPVSSLIVEKFPATLKLTIATLAIAVPMGLAVGIFAAWRHESSYDYVTMIMALIGISLPSFWLGLMLMFVFGVQLGWVRPFIGDQGFITLVLPAITLSAAPLATTARLTRSSMLDVLNEDYIRTAYAKGLSQLRIVLVHGLRNALIPVLTVIGLQFGYLLGGAVIVETVFVYPGLGSEIVNAILNRDFPVVQGIALISVAGFVLINLIVDLLYAAIDPRIAEGY